MITLQFASGTDLGSGAIKWFGHGAPFSHVDLVTPTGELLGARSDEIGGKPAGVQVRPADYLGSEKTFRVDVPIGVEETALFWQLANAQVGKPYDEQGIADFIIGRDWRDPGAWFCSELATWLLEQVKFFPFALATPCNRITPPDLFLVVSVLLPLNLEGLQ